MKKKNHLKDLVFFGAVLILVLVMIYSGLQILESTVFRSTEQPKPVSKTITRDGVEYFPRQDINVMLVMGIDEFGPMAPSNTMGNPGAADMLMLLIFDERNAQTRVLALNRDTMMDVGVLGIGGKKAGTTFAQLATAYTYGSGMEDSCENTRDTVSRFLYGITIDHYLSANMDAVSIMNDAVGGVTVTVQDDFSQVDPSIPMGQVTLMGEQALRFVRTRLDVGDQLNITRMERQEEYARGFMEAFRDSLSGSETFALKTYEQISPYVVTDCSATVLTDMMNRYADYEVVEIVSPAGENHMGEEYYEFYADEEALDALILRLFYAPKA
jgi:LCP family protein required for cell wall assembly